MLAVVQNRINMAHSCNCQVPLKKARLKAKCAVVMVLNDFRSYSV